MADTSVEVKNTIDIVGLNDIKANLKLEGGAPVKLDNTNTIDIKPLEIKPLDLGTDTHLAIDPLKLELAPLKSDHSMTLDLKPAVIDLCLTTNIGKLPNVCIRQPYHHHVGFTLFGTEVWGYTFSGQQETVIEELERQPHVAWRGAVATWPAHPPSQPHVVSPPSRSSGGLRVRLQP